MNKFTEVFRLSAPLSAAQFAQSAMVFCDTVLFGILGVAELAGGGLGAGIYHFLLLVATGIFSAVSAEVAISAGQGRHEAISRIVKAGLFLSLVVATIVALIILAIPSFLVLAGQEPLTIRYAGEYLSTAIWIGFPAFAFFVLRGLATGMGYTTSIMRISVIAVVVNVPLSYALMTGWGWFAELGLSGVAWGTVFSSSLMVVMLVIELWRVGETRLILKRVVSVSLQISDYRPFWALGVPIALAWVLEGGVFTAATLLAGTISVAALAAHQIALQTAAVSFNIYIGFAQGAAIRTGQCFGRYDVAGVRQYTWVGLSLGAVFCLLAATVFVVFPDPIVALFTLGADAGMDTRVRELGIQLLLVAALFQLVDGGQVIMMTALRAIRMGMPPTLIALFGYWIVGFPIAWLLMEPFGIVGVWAGLGLGLLFAFVFLTVMFIWKTQKLGIAESV